MNELAAYENKLTIGCFNFDKTGLVVNGDPTFEEWKKCGEFLKQAEKSVQFWIGDWLNYGEHRWGEMYTQAIEITGQEYKTVRNEKWVSSKIELSRRRDNLSFSHHAEVAQLEPEEQDYWLDKAEEEGLSRNELRKAIKLGIIKDIEAQIDRAELLRSQWGIEYGQAWKVGRHRIVCGDCNDPEILFKALEIGQPKMILTDPPYGIGLDTDYSKLPSTKPGGNKIYAPVYGDDKSFTYNNFGLDCAEEFWFGADYYHKSLPDGGSWIVWDKRVEEQFDAMFGSAFELIWSRQKHKREIIRCNNTLFSGEVEARDKLHPTVKPVKVIQWILSRYSEEDEIIIDMYAGAGTTIIACENIGRICTAIEIEPKYIAVSLQRFQDITGIIPILEK